MNQAMVVKATGGGSEADEGWRRWWISTPPGIFWHKKAYFCIFGISKDSHFILKTYVNLSSIRKNVEQKSCGPCQDRPNGIRSAQFRCWSENLCQKTKNMFFVSKKSKRVEGYGKGDGGGVEIQFTSGGEVEIWFNESDLNPSTPPIFPPKKIILFCKPLFMQGCRDRKDFSNDLKSVQLQVRSKKCKRRIVLEERKQWC